MSVVRLWLRVRRLDQVLVVAVLLGIGGAWVGSALAPVPGQLFADIAGVPLVYLSPAVFAVALAQWVPVGAYWIETAPASRATVTVLAAACLLAFLPPLLLSRATEVCLVSVRNGLLLGALVLCLRPRCTAAATSAAALAPCFVVGTFGWTQTGEPQPWALLLAPSASTLPLVATGLLLFVGLASVRQLHHT